MNVEEVKVEMNDLNNSDLDEIILHANELKEARLCDGTEYDEVAEINEEVSQ